MLPPLNNGMDTFVEYVAGQLRLEMHKHGTRPGDAKINPADLEAIWQKINPGMASWLAGQKMVPDDADQGSAPAPTAVTKTPTEPLNRYRQMAAKQSVNPIGTGVAIAADLEKQRQAREKQQVLDKAAGVALFDDDGSIPQDQIAANINQAMLGQHQYYRVGGSKKLKKSPYYQDGGKYR